MLFGRTAPPREERELIGLPALVIGHPADPLHPFTDSDMLVDGDAAGPARQRRVDPRVAGQPGRLDDELAEFVDEVYETEQSLTGRAAG